MSSPAQKGALKTIAQTGAAVGVNMRTLEVMLRKNWITRDESGLHLTKRGTRILEGRAGGSLPEVKKAQLRAHLRQHRPAKKKRDRAQTAREKKEHLTDLEKHLQQGEKTRRIAFGRILGPGGMAQAVKISRADGGSFTRENVNLFERAGWKVLAAGSVAARPGAAGVPGVLFSESDWVFKNPNTLGPTGLARALVLGGAVDRDTVESLAAEGYDVAAAPKKLREGITRNPAPGIGKKVYAALAKAADKRQALNVEEVARRVKAPQRTVEEALEGLRRDGLAWIAGRDLFGPCWMPGQEPQRGLFANPGKPTKHAAGKKALKKAQAWFWEEDEITEPQELRGYKPPSSGVLVGQIVAIEYRSKKDGSMKTYRHDVTKNRNLIISVDGGTLIIDPPFKITKRGIEG